MDIANPVTIFINALDYITEKYKLDLEYPSVTDVHNQLYPQLIVYTPLDTIWIKPLLINGTLKYHIGYWPDDEDLDNDIEIITNKKQLVKLVTNNNIEIIELEFNVDWKRILYSCQHHPGDKCFKNVSFNKLSRKAKKYLKHTPSYKRGYNPRSYSGIKKLVTEELSLTPKNYLYQGYPGGEK